MPGEPLPMCLTRTRGFRSGITLQPPALNGPKGGDDDYNSWNATGRAAWEGGQVFGRGWVGAVHVAAGGQSCNSGGEWVSDQVGGGEGVHRLPHGVGTGAVGACTPGDHRGGLSAAAEGDDVLLPERAGHTAGRAAGGGGPLRGAGAVHRVGHGSNVLCTASGAFVDGPDEDHEAGGWVAWNARLRTVGDGAIGSERLPAREAGLDRHSTGSGGTSTGGAVQRHRAHGAADRAARA